METGEKKGLSIILFSGDLDKAMAAFTIACAAAGDGYSVYIFFTFWGISLLRKERGEGRGVLEKMFKLLLPVGPEKTGLSKFNFYGLGGALMRLLIRKRGTQSLQDLIKMAMERKINFIACRASMKILGLRSEELIPYDLLTPGDAETFLQKAAASRIQLFI
ncbi:MAG TPA: hypothetical protein GXZ36_08095 [Firmicutes bacterium]|nr:hypothetical protein [Bacillota bacterium]